MKEWKTKDTKMKEWKKKWKLQEPKEGRKECPTSYWIVYSTKLRTSGLIRKFKKNESFWQNCKNVDFSINACVFSR